MALDLFAFIAIFALLSILWGKLLWYVDERSSLLRRMVFYAMTFSRRDAVEIKSILLTIFYLVAGGIVIALLSLGFGFDPRLLFRVPENFLPLLILGIFAEMSLSSLLMSLLFAVTRWRYNPVQVISEIPWVAGINTLSPRIRPIVPAMSGFVEELGFRGAGLITMILVFKVPPVPAIITMTILFGIQQALQTRNRVQAAVIGVGCIAISVVGGLLVVLTESALIAALSHASFVIFYFRRISPQEVPA